MDVNGNANFSLSLFLNILPFHRNLLAIGKSCYSFEITLAKIVKYLRRKQIGFIFNLFNASFKY